MWIPELIVYEEKHQVCVEGTQIYRLIRTPVNNLQHGTLTVVGVKRATCREAGLTADSQFPLKHDELQQLQSGTLRRERCPRHGPTGRCVRTTHTHTQYRWSCIKPMQSRAVREISPPISCLPDWADVETQSSFTAASDGRTRRVRPAL